MSHTATYPTDRKHRYAPGNVRQPAAVSYSPCFKCPFLADCKSDVFTSRSSPPCFQDSPRHREFLRSKTPLEELVLDFS